MKKLVLAFGALFAISMFSCTGTTNQDTLVDQAEQADSIEESDQTAQEVTGVVVDGAMNSVYLKVGDDTIEFTYPDLDSEHRASWSINDTLTVRYYETVNGDSVTDVINETSA